MFARSQDHAAVTLQRLKRLALDERDLTVDVRPIRIRRQARCVAVTSNAHARDHLDLRPALHSQRGLGSHANVAEHPPP